MSQQTHGREYTLGLQHKLCIHTGKISGSICNILSRNRFISDKEKEELIKLEDSEKMIDQMSFDDFYELVSNDKDMIKDW